MNRLSSRLSAALCAVLAGAAAFSAAAADVSMKYYPYELKLKHAFNLASMSRRATPGVQIEITAN